MLVRSSDLYASIGVYCGLMTDSDRQLANTFKVQSRRDGYRDYLALGTCKLTALTSADTGTTLALFST